MIYNKKAFENLFFTMCKRASFNGRKIQNVLPYRQLGQLQR